MGEKPRLGSRLKVGVGAGLWGAGPVRGGRDRRRAVCALKSRRKTLSGARPHPCSTASGH